MKFKSQDEGECDILLFLRLEYRTGRLDDRGDGGDDLDGPGLIPRMLATVRSHSRHTEALWDPPSEHRDQQGLRIRKCLCLG